MNPFKTAICFFLVFLDGEAISVCTAMGIVRTPIRLQMTCSGILRLLTSITPVSTVLVAMYAQNASSGTNISAVIVIIAKLKNQLKLGYVGNLFVPHSISEMVTTLYQLTRWSLL